MSDWSSFKNNKEISDKWKEFLSESEEEIDEGIGDLASNVGGYLRRFGQSLGSGRTVELPDDDEDEDGVEDTSPTAAADAQAGERAATAASQDELGLPISRSEMNIVNQATNLYGIVRRLFNPKGPLGAMVTQKADRDLMKKYKSILFPKLNSLLRRANIDLAEEVLSLEENEPLSRRTQAQKKGAARGRLGFKAAIKQYGDKPSLLRRAIEREFENALERVRPADLQKGIEMAFPSIDVPVDDQGIPDPSKLSKKKRALVKQKQQALSFLQKQPQRRLEIFKQNANEYFQFVLKMVDETAAEVLGTATAAAAGEPPATAATSDLSDTPIKQIGRGAIDRMRSRDRSARTLGNMRLEEEQQVYEAVLEAINNFYDKREK